MPCLSNARKTTAEKRPLVPIKLIFSGGFGVNIVNKFMSLYFILCYVEGLMKYLVILAFSLTKSLEISANI